MLHGYHNGVGMASAGSGAAGLAGIVAAVFALTAIASAGVLSAQPGWRRIAIRVVGSWVAAIGLLMLGWTLRSG
ncbi:MAG: hypothetical protein JNL07_04185 [Rhodospirillales bacterium]|nr:hypothetical protein [Rhodospirillales bacterium]